MSTTCPVCRCADAPIVHARKDAPVIQNALFADAASARAIARGQIEMRRCTRCAFVWNAAYDPGLISYDASYENDQAHSAEFAAHVDSRIERIAQCLPLTPAAIVEVGCGQGQFLSRLVEKIGATRIASVHGFDPAWRGRDGEGPVGGVRLYRAPFEAGIARKLGLSPDIVISRHTIEHVAQPLNFLSDIRTALNAEKPARLFLETPSNDWILARAAAQDLFYEHCSLFDLTSMTMALSCSGFRPSRLETVFGGQYIWAEATCGRGMDEADSIDTFARDWREWIERHAAVGRVAIWGAGAKGATFLHLVDPDAVLVSCVVDINPAKQGHHIPATGHAVVAPEDAAKDKVRSVILMNPNYAAECAAIAARLKWSPRFIVLDADETPDR